MFNLKKNLKPSYKIKIREEFNFLMKFFNHKKYKCVHEKNLQNELLQIGLEEKVYLQNIYGISSQGYYKVFPNDIKMIAFDNATISEGSDFIRLKHNKIYNPYFNFTVNKYFITTSPDYLKSKGKKYFLKNVNTSKKYKRVFNLVSSNKSWSHFLALVLPKIQLLGKFSDDKSITVITNEIRDQQILELIKIELSEYKNIELVILKNGESVDCETLFHIDLDSYIAIHGFLSSPHSIFISKFTREYWLKLKTKLVAKNNNQDLKLFIGRKGKRNVSNYKLVRDFFMNKGFVEIFPEEYTLQEKVNLFNSASHIVGPGSSGFTNIIFCQEKTKVVWFLNFARTCDTYLTNYCNENNIDLTTLVGDDEIPEDLNSNYYLNIELIKSYFNDAYFEI